MSLAHLVAVRNVALAGHGAAGKTTLAEWMLFKSGASPRLGSVDDGTSLLDGDDEERQHHFSITSHLAHFDHAGRTINLLDTPGYPDFIGQVIGALRAVETAVIVLSAASGIEVNSRKVFQLAGDAGLGRVIVINKLDLDNLRFPELIAAIQESFGKSCVLLNIPGGLGPDFTRVISTLELPADLPPQLPLPPDVIHQQLMDAIVETDDALLERYLGGDPLSHDQLCRAVEQAIAAGRLVPILCTSARTGVGVPELMDFLADEAPTPVDIARTAVDPDGQSVPVDPRDEQHLLAQVVKNRIDPFVSKLSCLRIFSGRITRDSTVLSVRSGKTLKIANLYRLQGNLAEPIDHAEAGDIVAVVKIDDLHIGDTLIDGKNGRLQMPALEFPSPMIALGVEPKSRHDQQKISAALHKIEDEDPTFHAEHEAQTHELLMRGMSELHLKIVEERLHQRDKVDVVTHPPRIPYRETLQRSAEGMYRHKKQTGGAGQFGEVHLRLYPFPAGTDPDAFCGQLAHCREFRHHPDCNFLFIDGISGGSIPNQFIPAVEKGILERMARGVLAGYPVQDLAVELHFGKYHDVDSNENAFRTAAAHCFEEVFLKAQPVLLEPIVLLDIFVPAEKVGEITSDLNGRRGRLEGIDPQPGGYQIIQARAPLSGVSTYARTLSGLTGGYGSFTLELSHYEPMPAHEQARIIAESRR